MFKINHNGTQGSKNSKKHLTWKIYE